MRAISDVQTSVALMPGETAWAVKKYTWSATGISAAEVWTSLITLTVVYGALAVVELWLIGRFVRAGVTTGDGHATPGFTPQPPDDEDDGTPRRDRDDDVLQFAY